MEEILFTYNYLAQKKYVLTSPLKKRAQRFNRAEIDSSASDKATVASWGEVTDCVSLSDDRSETEGGGQSFF